MSTFNGMSGSVDFESVKNVKSFSITDEMDTGRTLNFDSESDYEEIVKDGEGNPSGPKRWNGSMTADADTNGPQLRTGDHGPASLNAVTGHTWSGEIVVTEVAEEVEKGPDAVEITFNFEGDGELS